MYQNYIFDLYGTLVDIETNEEKNSLWKKTARLFALKGAIYMPSELKKRYKELVCEKEELLAEKGKLPREAVEIKLEEVFETLFLEKGIVPCQSEVLDMGLFFRNESITYIRLFPGTEALLKRLKKAGKKIWLLSNAQRIFTEPEMRMLDIYDYFDGILYSSDVGVKKPSSLFFDALMQRYNLRKEESVMTGNDSIADVAGAHEVGIASRYVHTRQSTPLTKALPLDCRRITAIGEVYSDMQFK